MDVQELIAALERNKAQSEQAARTYPERTAYHRGQADAYGESLALVALAAGPTGDAKLQADLLSVPEAAKYAGLSAKTIWRYIETGRLTAVRLGELKVRVNRADLDGLLRPV